MNKKEISAKAAEKLEPREVLRVSSRLMSLCEVFHNIELAGFNSGRIAAHNLEDDEPDIIINFENKGVIGNHSDDSKLNTLISKSFGIDGNGVKEYVFQVFAHPFPNTSFQRKTILKFGDLFTRLNQLARMFENAEQINKPLGSK